VGTTSMLPTRRIAGFTPRFEGDAPRGEACGFKPA
jgi:hypothetical protein